MLDINKFILDSGGYIQKTGGSSLVASTTTGAIYFDSGRAYIANNSKLATKTDVTNASMYCLFL